MPRVDDRRKEYDVLGLDCYATEVEVKKAFTRLSLKYHPDLHFKCIVQENQQYTKSKFNEICKAYKKIMADENCCVNDWNNDKSDEIFFSLLGELLQNSTRANELYTLLSSQTNNKSHFQNDNEYRCKEDVVEEDEDSDLNRLVDILKNRLQNGKSVPAGLTQDKLARLKDDFMKRNEENKKSEQNHNTPSKKLKTNPAVPVAKPKPKNKKQLQAEQRRRELEMANIARELEEKKKKEEEKEQVRKKQEKERQHAMEEEMKKQEEDKRKQLNETKKRKEKDEKDREQRSAKERERQERLHKNQEEEQRKKEEEKRRKAEEKASKQKATKESKEREERERLEKQQQQQIQATQKNQTKQRSQQYQQYQQQQQKYPREVPPRFLRQQQQQQLKQQVPPNTTRKDEFNVASSYDNKETWVENSSNNTSISRYYQHQQPETSSEDWDLDDNTLNTNQLSNIDSSWGGLPVSEDWDVADANKRTRSSVPSNSSFNLNDVTKTHSPLATASVNNDLSNTSVTNTNVSKTLFGPNDPPLPTATLPLPSSAGGGDPSWGASLTGSSWDTPISNINQWEGTNSSKIVGNNASAIEVPSTNKSLIVGNKSLIVGNKLLVSNSNEIKSSVNPILKSASPGITSWAGLDSFDNLPSSNNIENNAQHQYANYSGGAKRKTTNTSSFTSYHSDNSDKVKPQIHPTPTQIHPPANQQQRKDNTATDKHRLPTLDSKIDSNLKVTGWLQNSTPDDDEWGVGVEEVKEQDEDFGWTTVSLKTKKPTCPSSSNGNQVVPAAAAASAVAVTPSKVENNTNAWTNRALKQLLDMGFKREHAEKALRDNNGIIESAVSDLLMKGDSTEMQSSEEKTCLDNEEPLSDSAGAQPKALNRKQRRKLQQMQQNADQQNADQEKVTTSEIDATSQQSSETLLPVAKLKTGDGLLPTPPMSQRLIPSDKPPVSPVAAATNITPEAAVVRPKSYAQEGSAFQPIARHIQAPIAQPVTSPSKVDITPNTPAPIGTARPSSQPPAQSPIKPPKSLTNQQVAHENIEPAVNTTPLQPPVNPVLLAQMHLQQLGIQDGPPSSTYSPSSNVTSQTVTNTMIQQYLQQIAQTSEMESSHITSSSRNTPLIPPSSTMHLSGLLQQAPIPASSLSDGPQKSKLLQWTQSNSEPTTPPSADDDISIQAQSIDPISAKWGVIAAPRLSPTPAEFKPGVPWKPRGEPDGKSDDVDSLKENEIIDIYGSNSGSLPTHSLPTSPLQQTISKPALEQVVKPVPQQVAMSSTVVNQTKPTPNGHLPSDLALGMRAPPGLNSSSPSLASSSFLNGSMKTHQRVEDMNWLILRGISSAVDPSTLQSLCQQFGTLIRVRVIGNAVYVRYETQAQAQNAYVSLNGKIVFNTQIYAEVATETECLKTMESAASMNNALQTQQPPVNMQVAPPHSMQTQPMANQMNPQQQHPMSQGFSTMSSFGGLWTTPGSAQPTPQPQQQYLPQSYSPVPYGAPAPSTISMNGFNHWAVPNNQPVIPNGNQLWGPAQPPQQQPSNLYQPYPAAWVTAKQELPSSMFSPGMDRCLPSELFSGKEQNNL